MYFSPLPGRLANGNYRYHSNFKPSSSKSISFFSRTFKLLTLGMLINVPFHLVLLLLLLQYGFPDDQLLHTYIDRQWSTFWAIHSDPSHNLLYILVLVSSLQQSQFLPTPTRDFAHLPSFMMENQLLSPHISLDQFSDHLKVVTSEKPYREYVHNLVHLEMLQYGKSHVVIPAPLQSLFTDLPPNPTYSDVFDKFAQAYMQFLTHLCRDCQAEALLHHSEYKLNLYQRKAELLVSVIARFAKVFEFVTQHGECDLRFALKYGESGLIDETRFNLLRHKKQEKYLHWERFKNYITFIVAAIFYVASFITWKRVSTPDPEIIFHRPVAFSDSTKMTNTDFLESLTVFTGLVLIILVPLIIYLCLEIRQHKRKPSSRPFVRTSKGYTSARKKRTLKSGP